MRQYANAQQSGTVARTPGMKPDKMQPVIDRVMMIAERLVKVEKLVESQRDTIESQNQRIEELTEKLITLEKRPVATKPVSRPAKRAPAKKTFQGDSKMTKICKRGRRPRRKLSRGQGN